jgi:two-component system cell cycle sensor histidine kinase/response regulator CckA
MRIDPTQFQQVLLNLCFNARDAMPQGGKLTVRTSRQAGESEDGQPAPDCVVVEVSDTGAGMTPAVRRRIFEPFFTTKTRGTGFGLATVLGIVKRAGGTITVESKAGAGTTFGMRFPETAELEQRSGTALSALPATHGSEAVWLIESDELLRKMVSGILAIDGYKVTEFPEAAEVIESSPGGRPGLVVIDGNAKRAGELVRRLLARNPHLRVLSVSGEALPATWPVLPPGAFAHLPKPFALSTLLRAARGLLDGGR